MTSSFVIAGPSLTKLPSPSASVGRSRIRPPGRSDVSEVLQPFLAGIRDVEVVGVLVGEGDPLAVESPDRLLDDVRPPLVSPLPWGRSSDRGSIVGHAEHRRRPWTAPLSSPSRRGRTRPAEPRCRCGTDRRDRSCGPRSFDGARYDTHMAIAEARTLRSSGVPRSFWAVGSATFFRCLCRRTAGPVSLLLSALLYISPTMARLIHPGAGISGPRNRESIRPPRGRALVPFPPPGTSTGVPNEQVTECRETAPKASLVAQLPRHRRSVPGRAIATTRFRCQLFMTLLRSHEGVVGCTLPRQRLPARVSPTVLDFGVTVAPAAHTSSVPRPGGGGGFESFRGPA